MLDPHELYELADDLPDLGQPVLIQALTGFVDAGSAEPAGPRAPARPRWTPRSIATFDVDQLLDYRSRRPAMIFVEDHWESYEEPSLRAAPAARRRRARRSCCSPARSRTCSGSGSSRRSSRLDRPARRPADGRAQRDPDGGAAHPARPGSPRTPPAGADRRLRAVAAAGAGAGQRRAPARVPARPGRPRRDGLRRARAALPGPDRVPGRRRAAARPRCPGPPGCCCPPRGCAPPPRWSGSRSTGRSPRPTRPPRWCTPWRSSTTRSPAAGEEQPARRPRPGRCPPPTSWAPSWNASSPSRAARATTRPTLTRPGPGAPPRLAGTRGGRLGHAPGDLERQLGQGPAAPAAGLAGRHRPGRRLPAGDQVPGRRLPGRRGRRAGLRGGQRTATAGGTGWRSCPASA